MRPSSGFTLIEMMIAVAISSAIIASVYAALVSSQRAAEVQSAGAAKDGARMRAVELLKGDLRSRISLKVEKGSEDSTKLTLTTTADSLSTGETQRMIEQLIYTATPSGLKREEGKGAFVQLETGKVAFEFWENGAWRKHASPNSVAVRVGFSDPEEWVVIR